MICMQGMLLHKTMYPKKEGEHFTVKKVKYHVTRNRSVTQQTEECDEVWHIHLNTGSQVKTNFYRLT
ncbi:hypothetical protein AV530_014449 [Patagioenas fasciata monilis]|uniref:Uncharacterized protein n=1 Tax=Patagioenas fasciata monilis TaxID=372326 RepID=A0A1V4KC05_PATFA|nr:hypothetical protein AV530_014449 [Patagioenas fasciata monilis]